MPVLRPKDLDRLIEPRDGPCLSMYMPTERLGDDVKQNPIRAKNLLRQAEEALAAESASAPQRMATLEPLRAMIMDAPYWQRQADGLAVFAAPGFFRSYRQPVRFPELVMVGHRFYVKPLLPLLSGDGRFFIVALSKARVRVLRGTRYSVAEVEADRLPAGLSDVARRDEPARQRQARTVAGRGPGGRPAVGHVHGAGQDDDRDWVLRYFREADAVVVGILAASGAPVVLAGVEYLLPLYREASAYPNILPGGVLGNPDELSAADLHKRAWEIVGPHFEGAQRRAASQLAALQGTGRTSESLLEVVPAAVGGRVETLFLDVDATRWAVVDAETGRLNLVDSPGPGTRDAIDQAAAHTLTNGGVVYAVDRSSMPVDADVAAIFRY